MCSAGILRATLSAYAVALASLLLQFPKVIITALLFVAPFTYCYPFQDVANTAWAALLLLGQAGYDPTSVRKQIVFLEADLIFKRI